MPIEIRSFSPNKKYANESFLKDYLSKHFHWKSLKKDLAAAPTFPHLFIATDNNEIIGMLLLHENVEKELINAPFTPKGSIWIYRTFVKEEYRGQNVGSNLIKVAEAYAKNTGLKELWLDTDIPRAVDYYKKKHYTYIGKVPYKDHFTEVFCKQL